MVAILGRNGVILGRTIDFVACVRYLFEVMITAS